MKYHQNHSVVFINEYIIEEVVQNHRKNIV